MNKVYDKTEFLKYMNKRAKELYSSSELNYWDCYYALQTMNRCIAEILENGDSINIYKYWDIKPKLFKSVKRYSPLLNMEYEVPECKGFYVDTLGGSKKKKRKTYPQDIKRLIYLRNGGCCSICGKRMSLDECNLDHRIPLSKGGIDAVENLDCVHVKCNYIKADLMPDELEKGIKDIFLYQMEKNSGYKLRYRIAKAVLRKIC